MEAAANIEAELAQFTGGESYHYNAIAKKSGIVYTEGIRTLTMMAECWWVLDIICSYQQAECMKDSMLREMQFWTLKVTDNTAVLICERDSGDEASRQSIEYTDIPLDEVKIWLEAGMAIIDGQERQVMVAMLPSER